MVRSSIIFGMALLLHACSGSDEFSLEYQKLHIDTTNTCIFTWDTAKGPFPINSEPLPLRQYDLALVDSFLKDAVDSFNVNKSPLLYETFEKRVPLNEFIIDLTRYRKQYIPYRDVNGQRIMLVYAVCDPIDYWKTVIGYRRLDGGICSLEMTINLSENSYTNLRHGGFG